MEGINKMSADIDTNVKWQYKKDGVFELLWGDIVVLSAYAKAFHADGRMIDTRTSVLKRKRKFRRKRDRSLHLRRKTVCV